MQNDTHRRGTRSIKGEGDLCINTYRWEIIIVRKKRTDCSTEYLYWSISLPRTQRVPSIVTNSRARCCYKTETVLSAKCRENTRWLFLVQFVTIPPDQWLCYLRITTDTRATSLRLLRRISVSQWTNTENAEATKCLTRAKYCSVSRCSCWHAS